MKLRYDTKRSPIMSCILILIGISSLLFALLKVDLTKTVFGKIGTPEIPFKYMTQKQCADVLALCKLQNTQKIETTPDQSTQIAPPTEAVTEKGTALIRSNVPGTVYKYIDSNGMIVMVDDLEKVPVKYRLKMKTSSGTYGQQRTAVKVQNNQVWVPVTFGHNGRTVTTWLLLDTGATNTTISPALARRLGVHTTETTTGNASLADGRMVQTAYVAVDHVSVGSKVMRDLNVQILPRAGGEETGLLGMNFLGEFPHIVDAKAGIIRWQ